MKRIILLLLGAMTLIFLGGAIIGGAWYKNSLEPVAEEPAPAPVVFRVASGARLGPVAVELEERGLIRSALAFTAHARIAERASDLRAGEYELDPSASGPEILERLTLGQVRTHAVSIPEGLRLTEIADRLAEAELVDRDAFLEVASDPEFAAELGVEGDDLEGYLFPETYRLARGLEAREVARALVDEFMRVWREIEPTATEQGLSMKQVTTLASIIEKETGAPQERPLIAAVFLNRMRRGMRLETDPTVIYGIPDFDGNLRRVHLEDATNPYNTYRIPGLPPGPIASPGEASLRAVIEPADTPYIFFVARGDGSGTHHFSVTYR
ncbi:MAG: endolytic transglycosylase MltG [Myxococcota bacterium]